MIGLKFVVELVTWTLYLDCTSVYVWSIFNIVFHQGTLLGTDLLWQCWQSNPTRPKHRCGLPRTHLLLCLKHLSSHPVKTAFGFLAHGGTPCRRKSYCGIVSCEFCWPDCPLFLVQTDQPWWLTQLVVCGRLLATLADYQNVFISSGGISRVLLVLYTVIKYTYLG